MNVLDHPIWPHVLPYAHLVEGRDNIDLLQLPMTMRALALGIVTNCVSCGAVIHPFRARVKSERSRISGKVEEHRLFYAPTCPSTKNPGCSRTTAAQQHKAVIKAVLKGGDLIQEL